MPLVRMQQRRDTAVNWASANPVLASGEISYDTTAQTLRVGDGTTAWSLLPTIFTNVSPTFTGTVTLAAATASGLITANGGITVASGQTLTITGATITGLTAASVGAGTFPAGTFIFPALTATTRVVAGITVPAATAYLVIGDGTDFQPTFGFSPANQVLGIVSSVASANTSSAWLHAHIQTKQTVATSGSIQGLETWTWAAHTSGTVTSMLGLIGNITNSGGATVTTATCVTGGTVVSGGSTTTNLNHVKVGGSTITGASSVVTNSYGLYAANVTTASGGVVTNQYGIYIEGMTSGGTLNYAIYTNAGLVRFGDAVTGTTGTFATRVVAGIAVPVATAYLQIGDGTDHQPTFGFSPMNQVLGIVSSVTSTNASSAWLHAHIQTQQTVATSGTIQGLEAWTWCSHTSGTVTSSFGLIGNLSMSGSGGTTTTGLGVVGGAIVSGGAVVTNMKNVHGGGCTVTGAGSVITNNYALYAKASTTASSGVITNAYGLYVEAVTEGGTLNYAIYTAGGIVHLGGAVEGITTLAGTGAVSGFTTANFSGAVTIGGVDNNVTAGKWTVTRTLTQISANYDASNRFEISVSSAGLASLTSVGASAGAVFSHGISATTGTFSSTVAFVGSGQADDIAARIINGMLPGTGNSQSGVNVRLTAKSTTTVAVYAGTFHLATDATSFTVTNAYGLYVTSGTKGAGSTITNQYGLYIESQALGGTLNYAIKCNGGRVALSLPTSSAGLAAGDLWANLGIVTVA